MSSYVKKVLDCYKHLEGKVDPKSAKPIYFYSPLVKHTAYKIHISAKMKPIK